MTFTDIIPGKVSIHLFGRDWMIGPPTLDDWAAVARHLRERIVDPMPGIIAQIKDLPESMAIAIFREAQRKHAERTDIGPENAASYAFGNQTGFAFLLWLLIEKTHPGQLQQTQLLMHIIDIAASERELGTLVSKVMAISGMVRTGEKLAAAAAIVPPAESSTVGSNITDGSSSPSKSADSAYPRQMSDR